MYTMFVSSREGTPSTCANALPGPTEEGLVGVSLVSASTEQLIGSVGSCPPHRRDDRRVGVSIVNEVLEWPSRSDTALTWTPASSRRVAWACLRSWNLVPRQSELGHYAPEVRRDRPRDSGCPMPSSKTMSCSSHTSR